MRNLTNTLGNKLMNVFMIGGIETINNTTSPTANKTFEESELYQAFTVNINGQGCKYERNDVPERIIKSFVAATSAFLGQVKVSKPDQAVALVLTDLSGEFKFAAIVEYHENDNPDAPGNWSYVMTLNEEDLLEIEKEKTVNRILYGDERFKKVLYKVGYDIGGIRFNGETYAYIACEAVVDAIVQTLDAEANLSDNVELVLPGYVTLGASVEDGEKVFSITPDGAMKELIKSDLALEK